MSLPENWVDALFARLAARYGREWVTKWDGVDLAAVKADWADELAGFAQQPNAIRYGLDNLPTDWAPNARQFRELCRRAPPPAEKPEPLLALTREKAAEIVDKLHGVAEAVKATARDGDRKWSYALKARIDAGFKVPQAHRDMVNDAINGAEGETDSVSIGQFTPIPDNVLPFGMRGER